MRGFIYKAVIIACVFIIGFEFTIGKRIDPIVENLNKFNDEQLQIISRMIDPKHWAVRFQRVPADVEIVKGITKEANL